MSLAVFRTTLVGLLLVAAAGADEIVFRLQSGREGEVEVVRGKILGEDEKGQLRIQVAYGVITKPKELLVEVRPGIETMLEGIVPADPARYLHLARLVIAKQGTFDLGEQYPLEIARRLVFLAIQIQPDLYVEGHRILMGRIENEKLVGGLQDPYASLRYASRILRVLPEDPEARAVLVAMKSRVEAAEGDFKTRVSVFLRAYAEGEVGTFLRFARPFGRANSSFAQALAAAGDPDLARFLAEALPLGCDGCQLTGRQECRRCKGRGERPVNCETCNAKGFLPAKCKNCLGVGRFKLGGSMVNVYEICRTCNGRGEANYACPTCGGRRFNDSPCEDCQARGTLPCVRCGGDLWRGDAVPSLSPEAAREIARRYDPEGKAHLEEDVEGESSDDLDPSPIVPMGSRELDPPFDRPVAEVVYHAGRWVTVEEKARLAAEGSGR